MFRAFFARVSAEDLRLRFFRAVRDFSHDFIARLVQPDYSRSMALVAIDEGNGEMLGAVRLLADANFDRGEYGIMVRSDLTCAGIGWRLVEAMTAVPPWLGLNFIQTQALRETRTMLSMCRSRDLDVEPD